MRHPHVEDNAVQMLEHQHLAHRASALHLGIAIRPLILQEYQLTVLSFFKLSYLREMGQEAWGVGLGASRSGSSRLAAIGLDCDCNGRSTQTARRGKCLKEYTVVNML